MTGRGSTSSRGYDRAHKAERERWRPTVDAGDADCAELICLEERDGRGRKILPGTEWHLAHDHTGDPDTYRGPAHGRCNRSEASRRMHDGAQVTTSGLTLWWRP